MVPADESEKVTRRRRIDAKLRALRPSWEIVPFKEGLDLSRLTNHAVTEFPTKNGPADYALFVGGRLLGIIEAKKVGLGPQNVLEQAKRYSAGATQGPGNWRGQRVPFLYSSNGELSWFLDVRPEKHTSRQVSDFHTPDALEWMFSSDAKASYDRLSKLSLKDYDRLRVYQRKAIIAIEKGIMDGRREMLVAQATGTGKTFQTVALLYRLLEAKAFKRILFLVDRKALAAQAVREFAAFTTPQGNKFPQDYEVYSQKFRREDMEGEPFDPKVLPEEYLTDPKPRDAFVYVSTIQRMVQNLFGIGFKGEGEEDEEEDGGKLDIPIHAFDLIIADEVHRGYTAQLTSIWRDTMMYFDAVKVGLTATPALHTVALFGKPIFRYGVEEAIRDNFLVDYEAVAIESKVKMRGVFLKPGEQVGRVDTKTGKERLDQVEEEREFQAQDIERQITVPDTNRKIIEEVAKYARQHKKETGRFPKTLIFACNDLAHTSHADQLVKICRDEFNKGDEFVKKITGSPTVDRPLKLIKMFRNRENPKVVITVDMLSTGVDIPALEFIVFVRPVKSRILWEQMLGRGTRRCDDLVPRKKKFVIFDCFGGTLVRYFKDVSNFELETPTKTPLSLPGIIENIYENKDRAYHVKVLVKRLLRIDKDMSGKAREEFARFIPEGDIVKFAQSIQARLLNDFYGTMKLLRNKDFQKVLRDYPRAERIFIKAYETADNVTSDKLSRFEPFEGASGYLSGFSKFIKKNATKVEAIRILLKRPKDWNPEALDELREVLQKSPFHEAKLAEAHEQVHHKALADIISMVKHAARRQEPILTAEERVAKAIESLAAERTFTSDQKKWLGYIRQHLIENLTISEDDFDEQPVLLRVGGQSKAKQVFKGEFAPLLKQINTIIAAYGAKTHDASRYRQ